MAGAGGGGCGPILAVAPQHKTSDKGEWALTSPAALATPMSVSFVAFEWPGPVEGIHNVDNHPLRKSGGSSSLKFRRAGETCVVSN